MGKLLSNPNFYHALAAFAMSTGVVLKPEAMHGIVSAGMAASGAIHVLTVLRTHL